MIPTESNRLHHWARKYSIVPVALLSAVAVSYLFTQVLPRPNAAIGFPFLFAILAAAWWGGYGPGITVALATIPIASQLFAAKFSMAVLDPYRMVLVLIVSVLVSRVAAVKRETESQLRTSNEELEKRVQDRVADLEQARDLLHTTLASIADGVIAIDMGGRITFINSVAAELTGWRDIDAMNVPLANVFHLLHEFDSGTPPDLSTILQSKDDVSWPQGVLLKSRTGKSTPIELRATPMRKGDEVVGMVLVFRDTAERRAADAALQDSEERLRLALEAGRIGVWDWFFKENRLTWSPRVFEIHGVDPETFQVDVAAFTQLIHPDDATMVRERIQLALEGSLPYDIAFRIVQPGGNVRWVATTAEVFQDSHGKPFRMLGATTDITERMRLEQDLAELNQSLLHANSALEKSVEELQYFAYAASHDLQEPLRSVTIYAQLLEKRKSHLLDSDGAEYVTAVVNSAQRLSSLLAAIREYWIAAKPDNEPAELVDTGAAVLTALDHLRSQVDESGATILFDQLPPVLTHEICLVQIFQNLIGNAIKYRSARKPEIRITASTEPKQVVIAVEDNGIGFDQQFQDRIFGAFQRLEGRGISGAGMGLAICKRLIERSGGHIWAIGTPGVGARFLFSLPSAEASSSALREVSSSAAAKVPPTP